MANHAAASADAAPSRAMQVLAGAEAQLAVMPKAFDADRLAALRDHVSTYPDMGGPGAGEVAASLFMLLGRLQAGGCCDREALGVHIRAWRLMLTTPPGPEAAATLLEGLKRIRSLYADSKAA